MRRSNYKLFIEDILVAMDKIERYTEDMTYETFMKNELVVDAIIRNLEIIGEASRNIPEEVKDRYGNIPWGRMIALRNIAAHEYFRIDLAIIWEIVTENLPDTKPEIREMRDKEL